jgi:hypothetical protein
MRRDHNRAVAQEAIGFYPAVGAGRLRTGTPQNTKVPGSGRSRGASINARSEDRAMSCLTIPEWRGLA